MKKFISVIVPVYNAQDYLERCVKSILMQVYEKFEILLIDDGSTDRSGIICDEFSRENDFIRVLHQKNAGVSNARNIGLKNAKGEYVTFIDADDYISESYLSNLIAQMTPLGLVISRVYERQNNWLDVGIKELNKEEAQQLVFFNNGIQGFPFAKLFDLKLIREKKILFDESIAICEDMLFLTQYLTYTKGRIVCISEQDYFYTDNPHSALNGRFIKESQFNKMWLGEFEAFEKAERYLMSSPRALRACQLRKAKAAVTTLRTMEANNYQDQRLYNKLIKYARSKAKKYMLSDIGALSSKFSLLLGCISPRLEYGVYKLLHRMK